MAYARQPKGCKVTPKMCAGGITPDLRDDNVNSTLLFRVGMGLKNMHQKFKLGIFFSVNFFTINYSSKEGFCLLKFTTREIC